LILQERKELIDGLPFLAGDMLATMAAAQTSGVK
jgi:hypothetical protein